MLYENYQSYFPHIFPSYSEKKVNKVNTILVFRQLIECAWPGVYSPHEGDHAMLDVMNYKNNAAMILFSRNCKILVT